LVPRLLTQAAERAAGAVMALPSFAVATLVFLLATYFLLTRLPHLRVSLADSLPQGVRVFLSMLKKAAGTGLGGYLKAQLLLSVAVFFLLLGGFLLIRQPYALLLAAALALLDFLPLLGAGAALAPWGVVELLSGQVRRGVGILAVWGLVALFRRLAEPKVLGDQTGLSPMLSLASVYVGMKLGGVAGMLLGPILTLVVRDLCQSGVLDGALADLRRARKDLKSLFRSSLDDFS
jgi:sporulation integral membrane protein YtvI